ncbi:MAG: hypothetical protein PF484_10325 [Bacteroidales bacterium]|nr:hypothetical protein [Bacteroidales bacterium]
MGYSFRTWTIPRLSRANKTYGQEADVRSSLARKNKNENMNKDQNIIIYNTLDGKVSLALFAKDEYSSFTKDYFKKK